MTVYLEKDSMGQQDFTFDKVKWQHALKVIKMVFLLSPVGRKIQHYSPEVKGHP